MLSLCCAGLFRVTKDIQQCNGADHGHHHGDVNDFHDDRHDGDYVVTRIVMKIIILIKCFESVVVDTVDNSQSVFNHISYLYLFPHLFANFFSTH